ncbi:MAG: glycoside hydrolase family 127 protein [Flavobacterium sp.]|uniref:glycoside hydrolase family 127 protein n=1 Tax=Flavobacterium sp. TaxID=239 RepID=UPI00262831D6|nr:glycoside hydrolase family 127 protein [Flavobacterium sp.]MDD5149822.1 glycoside hydrolase family 127 protein [Flavobacterium sp.]
MKKAKQYAIWFYLIGGIFSLNAQDKLYPNEFPLSDVTLLESPFKHARNLNVEVLLKYNINRLLAPYRKEAGLPEKAKGFENWDGLDGHVGGHYLSALAMNYASTGDAECKKRMEYMIAELKACQDANSIKYPDWGVGYVGGVPNSTAVWPFINAGDISYIWKSWVPWYNVHKTYSGLRDAWLYTGNEEAKTIFLKFCDWGINLTSDLSDDKMEQMLGNEHGGMNEIFADAYQMTGNEKYITAAKRFSHQMLLDSMAANNDNLDNKHANTQVPKAIGFERIGELSHSQNYSEAGSFFWETVTGKRTLAFGGNSRREFFPSVASSEDFINDVEGPESCNTYNMLKLTEDLFRVNPLAKYADYYERAVYNHILSTQHPEHGGYVYFTPVRPRHYRVYSAPNQAMWCCVGSGMENHGKYNQFIYTHKNDSLYVNLFIASELNWKSKKLKLKQETNFPFDEKSKLTFTGKKSKFSLLIRYPAWVEAGKMKITINGKEILIVEKPSSYISINRIWKSGDIVEISLPMHNTVERLPNVPDYIALLHGPIVLGAKTGTENITGLVANDSRWGHIAGGERLPIDKAPIIIEDNLQNIASKLMPVANKPLTFTAPELKLINGTAIEFEPFFQIHDSRYSIYWLALSADKYKSHIDSLAKLEVEKLDMQRRTVDFIAPGEQQPEADHFIQKENSNTGNNQNQFWRDASDSGFFSYLMNTNSEENLKLIIRYWGAEWGNRKFDIYIDEDKLITENNTDRWNQSSFKDIEYTIPNAMIKGKKNIRVKFKPVQGNTAGAIYNIRLIKENL